MEENKKTMATVSVEASIEDGYVGFNTTIRGPHPLVTMSIAKIVKRFAELQKIPTQAALLELSMAIDIMDGAEGAAIDVGAIQKARERHEE